MAARKKPVADAIGISTSWNAAATVDGKRIVEGIASLGFEAIEVDYRVAEDAVRDIAYLVRDGRMRVLSVHNFTPLRPGEAPSNRGGDKHSLASLDRSEREAAVGLTERTLDVARSTGAEAVVIHLGEVPLGREYHKELVEVVGAEGAGSPRAQSLRAAVVARRSAESQAHLEAAIRSLDDILDRLGGADLRICVENRNYYHQIPLASEMLEIKRVLPDRRLCYWHDLGHAHALEVLGFASHAETLAALEPYLFGMHIHDALFVQDHRAPGTGEIDFARVSRMVARPCIKVLEFVPAVREEEIIRGLGVLRGAGLI